jgi:hypothetical protein
MIFPWYTATMLAVEASSVIGLRLMKIAGGGREALHEVGLMVTEKVAAAGEAGAILIEGGSAVTVIGRYRERVAANAGRLSSESLR